MHVSFQSFRPLTIAAAVAVMLASAPAHAFSDDEARKAILDLRQQVQQMNEQNARARLQLADQMQSMQQEVMQLREQLELVSRQQPSANQQAQQQQQANGPAANDPQEQAAYDAAIDQFRTGRYKEAGDALNGFVSAYPNSPLKPTAQFYLGSSRYATKDFKGAITQMQQMVEQSPNNERAPDALLVIAGSQIETNNRAGAKTTLQRIVRDYPSSPAASTAKNRLTLLQ
ncbi:tol-pal system protein YbgF [Schauerella aestuarii]|uniref:tol-pal system protein YbgF n=1 Tax=Schauerella aestuarii TaxID=2511204 RepID=UPI0013717F3F|nr:tol-pal system protein YbgF [Achromobacter aestuarii]